MKSSPVKKINLALQGGGAHGAFTWGVLETILEDERLEIDGITATSAGSMNACVFAYGLHQGGRAGAKEALHRFWRKVHEAGLVYNPVRAAPWDGRHSNGDSVSFGYFLFESITRVFSPYQTNPFDINPLRRIVADVIDFEALQKCDCVKLFLSATDVRTGRVHVFKSDELTLDAVMASACLPNMFKAVEVGGAAYWDGGYMGNPALFPLFYYTDSRDVLIVHINPIERDAVPTTAVDIMNRMNEISFNASLLHELRAVAFVKKLLQNDMLRPEYRSQFKDVLVHSLRTDDLMCDLSVASKFQSDWEFLTDLRDRGRKAAAAWLKDHFDDIGVRETLDIHEAFLSPLQVEREDQAKPTSLAS